MPIAAGGLPTGASLTGVTLNVIVFGGWSRSKPPLAVPPSSFTWKVKVVYGVALLFVSSVGVNFSLLAAISLTRTAWPAVTATSVVPLFKVTVPLEGNVVTISVRKLFGATELGG